MINQQILDKILLHYIGIERLKAGAINRYTPLLSADDNEILGLFSRSYNKGLAKQNEFIRRVKAIKQLAYGEFEIALVAELNELAIKEGKFIADMMIGYFSSSLANEASPKALKALINQEIRGITISEWIEDLKNTDIKRFIYAAKVAVSDGLTLAEASEGLQALNIKRDNHSKTVIRTLIHGISNKANGAVFKENSHLIKGVRLSVTFDNKTTPICIGHSEDNILYPVDNYPMPGFHQNCRTVAVVETKSWKELGAKNQGKVPESIRQSMDGGTPSTNTYGMWLKTQPSKIQDEVLGKRYGKEFRTGKYKITKFIDPTGKFYTIKELFG